jgi:hypothetical protein
MRISQSSKTTINIQKPRDTIIIFAANITKILSAFAQNGIFSTNRVIMSRALTG